MSILIDENTKFLIQGITGKQGQKACEEMLEAGSKVVAGVTPGKGGQEVCGVPVYNSIKDAREKYQVDATVIFVPAKFAKSAIVEAIEAEIPLVNIITENIPVHDMAYCLALAKNNNVKIIGATSAGIYSVGKAKCGPIASGKSKIAFTPGPIGVISRSGGMSCETSLVLTQAGLGQSTVVSIGSDVLMGESFLELVKEFEKDPETKGIVLFGEIGGTAEEDLAAYLINQKKKGNPFPKPIVAFISGKFAENNNIQNVSLGHAGAIIEGNKGTRENKVKVLKEGGVMVAEVHHEVGKLMKKVLEGAKRMEFKTRISKLIDQDVVIRKEKLSALVREGRFSDTIFLLLSGRRPNQKESVLFEKMLVSVIDHGMGTTSSMATRFVASGGNALNVGVGAGVLSIGDYHGGAIEKAMEQFYAWEGKRAEEVSEIIKHKIEGKEKIFGFGHRVYKEGDPRVKIILEEMEKIGFGSKFAHLKEVIENTFMGIKGKRIPLNIDGLMAILLCDFGFDPLQGKGIFIIGRTPGLVAQCYEELKYEKPVRRVDEGEIEFIEE